jgi:hypothetical protein
LVLIKSVLQAIPTYLFLALETPQSVIKTIQNLQRNFLWHGHDLGKKWALVSWEKVCKPKSIGGLGLRDPSKLNNIMGINSGGIGSSIQHNFGPRFGRKNMPHTPTRHISLDSMIRSKALIFGMQPGAITLSFRSTHSGKFRMVRMLCFGWIHGNNYLHCIPWTTCTPSRIICNIWNPSR